MTDDNLHYEDKTNKPLDEYWQRLKQPPKWALRTIGAGRLKGKTDINPQWRYQAMTKVFGPCGIGWRYEIARVWDQPTVENQVMAFAEVNLFIKVNDEWSEPIPGVGGSMLVAKEKSGPYASDECYKMAITDALSVALKMLGVAADIYAGLWDGTKYNVSEDKQTGPSIITKEQAEHLDNLLSETTTDRQKFLEWAGAESLEMFPAQKYQTAIDLLGKKEKTRVPGMEG